MQNQRFPVKIFQGLGHVQAGLRKRPNMTHGSAQLPRARSTLLDAVKISPGSLVLDVACGPGYAAAKATERGAFARGVDFAPTMVAEARRRFLEVPFAEGDAERLALRGRQFRRYCLRRRLFSPG